jgi:hypothetical protein
MSFLKKEGQRVWVPEVISKIWVPGRWEEKKVTERVYVPGNTGGSTGGDRYMNGDFGLSGGDDYSGLIVDY